MALSDHVMNIGGGMNIETIDCSALFPADPETKAIRKNSV